MIQEPGQQTTARRGRGRPKGSRNRTKSADGPVLVSVEGGASLAGGSGASSIGSIGRVPASPRRRSADELADVLCKILGGVSLLAAEFVFHDGDVAMLPEEAAAIAEPTARLLDKTKWAKRVARKVRTVDDVIDLSFGVAEYGLRAWERDSVREKVSAKRGPQRQTTRLPNGNAPATAERPTGRAARPAYTAVNAAATAVGPADGGAGPGSGIAGIAGIAGYGAEPIEGGHAVNYGNGIKPPTY